MPKCLDFLFLNPNFMFFILGGHLPLRAGNVSLLPPLAGQELLSQTTGDFSLEVKSPTSTLCQQQGNSGSGSFPGLREEAAGTRATCYPGQRRHVEPPGRGRSGEEQGGRAVVECARVRRSDGACKQR